MHTKILYTVALLAISSISNAQHIQQDLEKFKQQEVLLNSDNAAFLQQTKFSNIGNTSLKYDLTKGDFKHPLMAREQQYVGFSSERYQQLKDWKFYGKFNLDVGNEKEVAYTTQLNPLRINPYTVVDSLGGNWNKQRYALQAKIASPLVNDRIGFGLGLQYNVSTGARQRDPRPENTNNYLELTPSLTYVLDPKSTLGINGNYSYFVEDLAVSNINTQTVHNMYKLIGLGEYVGSSPLFISSSPITRKYTGNKFGGNLQYLYQSENIKLLVDGFLNTYSEHATDGVISPQQAGKHQYLQYGTHIVSNIIRESALHTFRINWDQKDVDNTEYHQYQDPTTREYITLFSDVFNTNLVTEASIGYQMGSLKNNILRWQTGISVTYDGLDNRYASNQSQQTVDRLTYRADFKRYFVSENASGINVQVGFIYSDAVNADFAYDEKSYSTNFIAHHILYPANQFLSINYWGADAALQYNFKRAENRNNQFYVRLSGNYLQPTSNETYFNKDMSRIQGQLSIGLYSL
ncbi:hypothetical protein FAZ19_11700 [Sphingobacterium alkalisoli]|uniref:DUF6850 domain-containing protein n=1 Tax=Sphingobacterium alkalisoli TaxID=1874115 RepID=A0A4U0H2R4_9SPHI|nr:DUF6850 family outer membrane beta-barrel protein [Sphingobacterium alkalisoli]TJY65776.1 hypothetical protein FAZ19_11700 [Sphingobacterium alkalisoli]